MGDFNSIRAMDDRIGRNPIQQSEVTDFNSFMVDHNMTELKTVGRRYTWTNSHIHSKIDWAIVNGDWINKLTHIETRSMDLFFSDHSLIAVKLEEYIAK